MSFQLPHDLDIAEHLLEIDRVECEESLYTFMKRAWRYMDPAPFTEGWHIAAICEHLQAVCDGEITRLMVHLPPRHCKSLTLAVSFPAWVWAQTKHSHTNGPGVPFLFASYADKLSLRDSVKCRRLIESPWYQARWGNRFQIHSDQNQKSRYGNSAGGERLITSIGAGVTGEGGNIICFPGDEVVATEHGYRAIGDIVKLRAKIRVWSRNLQTGERELKPITRWFKNPASRIVKVIIGGSGELHCTPGHHIWTDRGWVRAIDLKIDDSMVCALTPYPENCENVVFVGEESETFCIEVEGNHNFEAGYRNVIVKNCIDDPNAANEVESEATTTATIDWWTSALSTRTNDADLSAIIIIQQRLRENDLSGYIMEHEFEGWTHLCLPGRFEKDRKCYTSIGWEDPREEDGELLWPQRFSEAALKRLERTMGPFIFAGQIQQRPEPAGGGIIKSEWWQIWVPPANNEFPEMDFVLACLDTAFTADSMNDPSGMLVWGVYSSGGNDRTRTTRILDRHGAPIERHAMEADLGPRALLMDAWTERLEFHDLVTRVAQVCIRRNVHVLMIENKASGISVAQELRRLYSDHRFAVHLFDPKSQDKVARLYSVQHLFAEGLIFAPDRDYVRPVILQVSHFPKAAHDEYVDCTSMGLRYLRDSGMLQRQVEREAEDESLLTYPGGREQPLYPC